MCLMVVGINREEGHLPCLQVLIYDDEDDTNNNNCYIFIMTMAKMNVLLKVMVCRSSSGDVLGSRAPSCFQFQALENSLWWVR